MVDWVVLWIWRVNKGQDVRSLYTQLVCRRTSLLAGRACNSKICDLSKYVDKVVGCCLP